MKILDNNNFVCICLSKLDDESLMGVSDVVYYVLCIRKLV